MSARLIDGIAYAQQWKCELLQQITSEINKKLAVVLVGDDERSHSYVQRKQMFFSECGVLSEIIRWPNSVEESKLLGCIQRLNSDDSVGGILVKLPLPKQCDQNLVLKQIAPGKDVDGLSPEQQGLLLSSSPNAIIPATPRGILQLLEYESIDLVGKRVVIVNDSILIGKPLAICLLNLGATVTICNRCTVDLASVVSTADVLVTAIGKVGIIKPQWFKPDAVVLDVGISMVSGKLRGDVDYLEASK